MEELGNQVVGADHYLYAVEAALTAAPGRLAKGVDGLLDVVDVHLAGHDLGVAESGGRHGGGGHDSDVAVQLGALGNAGLPAEVGNLGHHGDGVFVDHVGDALELGDYAVVAVHLVADGRRVHVADADGDQAGAALGPLPEVVAVGLVGVFLPVVEVGGVAGYYYPALQGVLAQLEGSEEQGELLGHFATSSRHESMLLRLLSLVGQLPAEPHDKSGNHQLDQVSGDEGVHSAAEQLSLSRPAEVEIVEPEEARDVYEEISQEHGPQGAAPVPTVLGQIADQHGGGDEPDQVASAVTFAVT